MEPSFDGTLFSVGKPFPLETRDSNGRTMGEGVMYTYQDDIHFLLIRFRAIRSFERQAVERGMIQFALYVEDDMIVLLCKLHGPSGKGIDWHDPMYSWHLTDPAARTLPPVPAEGERMLMHIFLIDDATGIIAAMRALTLSPAFTAHLHAAIRAQAASPFDRQEYFRQVARLHQRFPKPSAFLNVAQVRCLGGE